MAVCALKSLGGNPLAAELERRGVPFEVVGSAGLRDVVAFRRLLARLRREPPDLLHAHLADATIWGAALARRLGRPAVATLHVLPGTGAVGGWRGGLRRRVELRALARMDAVLAVSGAVREAWGAAGLPADRVEVVHNGVDTAAIAAAGGRRQAMRRRLGIAGEAPLLVTVSVLRRGKGLGTLLAAFERLLAARPEARLAVVGDGPEEERRRRTAEPLGDRVIWAGYQADVAPWLAAADLFVLPSRGDAFPTALLEAAAAGLPAVASASGGVPEIVADGETGVLVPPARPVELTAAVEALLADPARRAAMGEAARRRAEERFSLAAWGARLEAVYRRVVAEHAAGGAAPASGETGAAEPAHGAAGGGDRPLRIAVVEPAARGGMIHYAHQLCRGLAAAGAEPTLVTARA
ncbi:MAG TPA: glycosyltransferase family 4 protein, partial [Thermoanaerobaculia bacterium]